MPGATGQLFFVSDVGGGLTCKNISTVTRKQYFSNYHAKQTDIFVSVIYYLMRSEN
jgi:hypothetical protein